MRLAPATPIVVGAAIDTVIIIVFVIIIISHIGESPIRDIIIITNTLCSELQLIISNPRKHRVHLNNSKL